MLAAWQDYVYPWQFPLLVVFLIGWLLGGGFLLRVLLRKHLPPRRVRLGRCVLASLAGGAAGVFASGVFFVFMRTVAPSGRTLPSIPAMILCAIGFVALFYLVLYTMFDLPLGAIVKAGAPAIGATVALGMAVAVAAGLPARTQRLRELARQASLDNLRAVHKAVADFERRLGKVPATLGEAIEKGYLDRAGLPGSGPELPYIYDPSTLAPAKDKTQKILLCEHLPRGEGRAIAYASRNTRVEWVSDDRFRQLLALKENAALAERLAAADEH